MTLSDAEKYARRVASGYVEKHGDLLHSWQVGDGKWMLEFALPNSAPGWSSFMVVKPSGKVDRTTIAPASELQLKHI